MKTNNLSLIKILINFLFFLFLLTNSILYSQTSDATLRKIGFFTGNNIGLTAYNDGAISGFNQGVDIRGEWPLGSGENYIGDITPCIGIELPIKDYNNDGLQDTIHSVIISRGPRLGQGDEKHPIFGYFWGFNPLPDYVNENSNSFALSNDQNSWPTNWGGVWPGLYKTGEIVANQEAYFKMDNYWDDEFNENFYPIKSDSTITGLGIEVAVRLLQFNSLGLEDVFFRVYDITNNSDYNYAKVFFGNVTGTLMGGDGDSSDDLADVDDSTGIIYSWDSDGIGNNGQRTATMGEAFIESPSFKDIGEFKFFTISASPNMSNDELLWDRFTKPINYLELDPIPYDGDILYSTKLFSLNSKETKRIVSIIAFDYLKEGVEQKALLAEALWHNQFDEQLLLNNINIIDFDENSEFSNEVPIRWESENNIGNVEILYSGDFGNSWKSIVKDLPNNGSYDWNSNISNINESAFAQIKLILNDGGYYIGNSSSNYFILNLGDNGTPNLNILNEEDLYYQTLTDYNIDLSLLIGDSEKELLSLNIYYKTSKYGSYEFYDNKEYPFSNVAHLYNLNLKNMPNSDELYLKFELSDSENKFVYETQKISKNNEREAELSEYLTVLSGYSESNLKIYIVDEEELIPEEYLITFDDTSSTENVFYNVEKTSDGSKVLENELLLPKKESKVFNGIVFEPDFVNTELDASKSFWSSSVLSEYIFSMEPFINFYDTLDDGYGLPNDYKIVFYEENVNTSVADTLKQLTPPFYNIIPAKPVNFRIWNVTQGEEVNFTSFNTGTLTSFINIWLHEDNFANRKRTWRINIFSLEPNNYPVGIDTLYLVTQKGFSIYDSLVIRNLVSNVAETDFIPSEYQLSQNYPNPFNPVTNIEFSIPTKSYVSLKIYNILGEEVKTLVSGVRNAGKYIMKFDASNLASGIYIYRIKSGTFSNSKKLVLLK